MDKLRMAIVGCGNISQLNANGYLKHPQCEVVALCDTVQSKAEHRAQEWGITPRIYTDYAEMLADPGIDAVELLTPTFLHPEQIIQGLEAGKHVSCQKPMCVTVEEADRIIAAVEQAKTLFRITENFLYYPPILKAKELLDQGVIGEPSLFRCHSTRVDRLSNRVIEHDPEASVWRRDPARNTGGLLYDDGIHKYATATYWIGEIDQIISMVGKTDDFIMETPSVVTWRFKDRDCLGILDYTHAPDLTMRGKYVNVDEFFEIHGTKGIIWVTRCSGEMLDLPPVMVIKGTETQSYQVPMDWLDSFDGAATDFIESVLQQRQPKLDAHQSKQLLQVALAIYEAARTERPARPSQMQ